MQGIGKPDWILFALTIYPSLFLLQFANTPLLNFVHHPRPRRTGMAVLLGIEILLIVLAVRRWA